MKKTLFITTLSLLLPFFTSAQPWNQLGDDMEGEAPDDRFGFALSLDGEGNSIVIGSHRNDGNGEDAGRILVMDWDGIEWTQRGSVIYGEAEGDDFGHKVCMSGDGNVVMGGAQWNDGNGYQTGHARVFSWDSNQWVQKGSDLSGVDLIDYFGQCVRMSYDGHIIAVAGAGFSGNFTSEGVVRVYSWNGTDWEQMGTDIVGGAFGAQLNVCDLSSDGLTLAAGSWGNDTNGDDSGQVRVFTWDGQSWVQKGGNLNGEASEDRFGSSVRLSADGTILAAGAPYNDGAGPNRGVTKVYNWDGTNWLQIGQSIYGEADEDLSAYRIGMNSSGNKLIIGAVMNDDGGEDSGHARVYQYESSNWVQLGDDIDGEAAGDWAGFDVDMNDEGDIVAMGARNNSENGHVRVFGEFTSNLSNNIPVHKTKIFPNPSSYAVNVELVEGSKATVKVFTMDGKLLYQKDNIIASIHSFNLEAIPGLYIVEITTNTMTQRHKLIKH